MATQTTDQQNALKDAMARAKQVHTSNYFRTVGVQDYCCLSWYLGRLGYSRKNPNRMGGAGMGEGWGYTFLKSLPRNFRSVTLPQEIPERKNFYPWKFCKFVLCDTPLEIPKSKTKTHGNSALVFLEHPWNFHFFFNWPLEVPHVFPSRSPPEVPCPQPPCFNFFYLE